MCQIPSDSENIRSWTYQDATSRVDVSCIQSSARDPPWWDIWLVNKLLQLDIKRVLNRCDSKTKESESE